MAMTRKGVPAYGSAFSVKNLKLILIFPKFVRLTGTIPLWISVPFETEYTAVQNFML